MTMIAPDENLFDVPADDEGTHRMPTKAGNVKVDGPKVGPPEAEADDTATDDTASVPPTDDPLRPRIIPPPPPEEAETEAEKAEAAEAELTPEEALDDFWPNYPQASDQKWIRKTRKRLRKAGNKLAARPKPDNDNDTSGQKTEPEPVPANYWNPKTAARIMLRAIHFRTDTDQTLWAYDPQVAHYVTGPRVDALLGRLLQDLINHWKPIGTKNRPLKYSAHIKAQVRLLLTEEHPSIIPHLPKNEYLLGYRNGVLDLRNPENGLQPHHPKWGITRTIPWNYNPQAQAPKFLQLATDVIPDTNERRLYQQQAGVALSELLPPQQVVVIVGTGGTGKTQLQECVKRAIGDKYILNLDLATLGENQFQARKFFGKAANMPSDLSNIPSKNTAAFKELTGNDLITAERKHINEDWEFRSRAAWLCATNELPAADIDKSEGFFRRWLPIAAGERILELLGTEHEITNYAQEIIMADTKEAEGVVKWMTEGATDFIRNNRKLTIPRSVISRRNRWRFREDRAAAFIHSYIIRKETAFAKRIDLNPAFEAFLDEEGFGPKKEDPSRPAINSLYDAIRNQWAAVEAQEVKTGSQDKKGFRGIHLTYKPPKVNKPY